jgi:hypothetical protein
MDEEKRRVRSVIGELMGDALKGVQDLRHFINDETGQRIVTDNPVSAKRLLAEGWRELERPSTAH